MCHRHYFTQNDNGIRLWKKGKIKCKHRTTPTEFSNSRGVWAPIFNNSILTLLFTDEFRSQSFLHLLFPSSPSFHVHYVKEVVVVGIVKLLPHSGQREYMCFHLSPFWWRWRRRRDVTVRSVQTLSRDGRVQRAFHGRDEKGERAETEDRRTLNVSKTFTRSWRLLGCFFAFTVNVKLL